MANQKQQQDSQPAKRQLPGWANEPLTFTVSPDKLLRRVMEKRGKSPLAKKRK
jgi:hypothetical protein